MSEIKKLACPYCGNGNGSMFKQLEAGKLTCECCGTNFYTETAEAFYDKLTARLSEDERKKLIKNLCNMNREGQEKFPDKALLTAYAQRVKELEPEHPIANMFELLCAGADASRAARYFDGLKAQKLTLETKRFIVEKFIENFDLKYQLAVAGYISAEILPYDRDAYKELFTKLEEAAEKENAEGFNTKLRRDVFIAHSSKDTALVSGLAEALDKAGRTYFLSSVNLKHGLNAKSAYDTLLKEAIESCTIFLVINTNNARQKNCDVYAKELPFVRELDKASTPPKYRQYPYKNVPTEYKKWRINYLVGNYADTVQDESVKEFFDGFEYRITLKDVLLEVERLLTVQVHETETPPKNEKPADGQSQQETAAAAAEPEKPAQAVSATAPSVDFVIQDGILIKYRGTSAGVVIPDSVKTIGGFAFRGGNVKSVSTGNGVTTIGNEAFRGCTGLKSITIGNGVTNIGESAFAECTGLTSVTIGNKVKNIGSYAFYNCTGLKNVTIENDVKTIGEGTFSACTGLTSVTLSDSVTDIGSYAFNKCTGLTDIIIPDSVIRVGIRAFWSWGNNQTVYVNRQQAAKWYQGWNIDCAALIGYR